MEIHPAPKKRFGQNFLINKNYAHQIVDSLQIQENDTIIEIGPGRGILTEIISDTTCEKRIAVEIDEDLAQQIELNYSNIDIYKQDILSFSYKNFIGLSKNKLKIIGNIPYNITSPILFHLLDNSDLISRVVLMMQKEVAERLLAVKDTKDYGILTVLLNAQARVEKILAVSRKNFYPQPKVDSMVIRIQFLSSQNEIDNYELFKRIVKNTFNNRRKMLKNSLQKLVDKENLSQIKSVPLYLRPENLTVSDFMALTNEINQLK